MLILEATNVATITFRGKQFLVSAADFERMAEMRNVRIDSGAPEQFKTVRGVRDHFAQAGIRLVPGGEVCPVELAIMVGPTGEGDRLLRVLFGERWFDIEETGWKAA